MINLILTEQEARVISTVLSMCTPSSTSPAEHVAAVRNKLQDLGIEFTMYSQTFDEGDFLTFKPYKDMTLEIRSLYQ